MSPDLDTLDTLDTRDTLGTYDIATPLGVGMIVHAVAPLDGTALLKYALQTDPAPVQASPSETTLVTATLKLVVNCPRELGSVSVRQLTIAIPVDPDPKIAPRDPTNLAAMAPPKDAASISSSGPEHWTPKASVTPGVYTFTPDGGPVTIAEQSLAIVIANIPVSPLVGTTALVIREWAAAGGASPPPVTDPPSGSFAFDVPKFPPDFHLGVFQATPANIDPGADPSCSTMLSWNGSAGASYTILYDDVTIPAKPTDPPLPPQGSYQVSDLRDDLTAFTLVVKAGGGVVSLQQQAMVRVNRAKVVTFTAYPSVLGRNAKCAISWLAKADRCELDTEKVDTKGARTIVAADSMELTLTAIRGQSIDQQTRNIKVVAPVVRSFQVLVNGKPVSGPVDQGTVVTLTWETQYAETIAITPSIGPVGPSSDPSKPVTYTINEDTNFVLTCTGKGPDVTSQKPVAVNRVQIVSFTVTPNTIPPGGSATLAWSTKLATSGVIDGIGQASLPSGSIVVRPSWDVNYALRCEGPMGPITANALLTVMVPRFDDVWGRVDGADNGYLHFSTRFASRVVVTGSGFTVSEVMGGGGRKSPPYTAASPGGPYYGLNVYWREGSRWDLMLTAYGADGRAGQSINPPWYSRP